MGTATSAIQLLIRRAASAYAAGPTLKDARAACERAAQESLATVVCYWNSPCDAPEYVSQSYLDLLALIPNLRRECYLSVKAPALGFDFELIRTILNEAKRLNVTLHFDAMSHDSVDKTFDLIDEAQRIYSNLGCTLPGRWRRSIRDADWAADLGLRVRVVKGEWPGLNGDEVDRDDGFAKVVERLAARGARHVAVATHDTALACKTLDHLARTSTPCELELLYGLPQRKVLRRARERGVTARIYVGYGHAGLPYRLKDALRHPRVITWFARDLLRGSAAA